MDSIFIEELRDLWVEHGTDMDDWTDEAKREAAVAFYEADDRRKGEAFADALAMLAASDINSAKVIRGFKRYATELDPRPGSYDIAGSVIAAMLMYPMTYIAETLAEREPDFKAWKREDNARGEADSLNDAAG